MIVALVVILLILSFIKLTILYFASNFQLDLLLSANQNSLYEFVVPNTVDQINILVAILLCVLIISFYIILWMNKKINVVYKLIISILVPFISLNYIGNIALLLILIIFLLIKKLNIQNDAGVKFSPIIYLHLLSVWVCMLLCFNLPNSDYEYASKSLKNEYEEKLKEISEYNILSVETTTLSLEDTSTTEVTTETTSEPVSEYIRVVEVTTSPYIDTMGQTYTINREWNYNGLIFRINKIKLKSSLDYPQSSYNYYEAYIDYTLVNNSANNVSFLSNVTGNIYGYFNYNGNSIQLGGNTFISDDDFIATEGYYRTPPGGNLSSGESVNAYYSVVFHRPLGVSAEDFVLKPTDYMEFELPIRVNERDLENIIIPLN